MKRLIPILLLISCFALRSSAADATINNAPGGAITTVPDTYVMPWEFPNITGFKITFSSLTNQILAGMASQGYASGITNPLGSAAWKATSFFDVSGAAQAATNGYPWGVLYDPAGAASGATGALGSAAFKATSFFDVAGAGTTAAQAVTNGYPWGTFYYPMTTNPSNFVHQGDSYTNLNNQLAAGSANWFDGTFLVLSNATAGHVVSWLNVFTGDSYHYGGSTNTGSIKALNYYGSALNMTDLPTTSIGLVTNIWTTNTTGQVLGSSISGSLTNNTTGTAASDTTKLDANGGTGTNLTIYGNSSKSNSWTYGGSGVIRSNTAWSGLYENSFLNSTGITFQVVGSGNTNAFTIGTNGQTYGTFTGSLTGNASSATTAGDATTDSLSRNISTTYAPLAGTNVLTGSNVFSGPVLMTGTTSNRGTAYFGSTGQNFISDAGFYLGGYSSFPGITKSLNATMVSGFGGQQYYFDASLYPGSALPLGSSAHPWNGIYLTNTANLGPVVSSSTGTFTNGVASKSRNLLAPVSISVTGSPFNWTNSIATNNISVFIDGAGVTGTVGLNGTTIFSSLAGADATVPMQPGEYLTVTYTIGTPVMWWKPF